MIQLFFLIKLIFAIIVVLGLSFLAENVSPRVAGILSGYPTTSAISLFFYGLEISPEFAARSAVYNIVGFIVVRPDFCYTLSTMKQLMFVPLNFVFTILLITFGIFSIKYAKSIFKLEKKCFNPVVIMYSLLTLTILGLTAKGGFDNETWINLGSGLAVIVTLFIYKEKFTY